MPDRKLAGPGVTKDERRRHQPEATRELGDFLSALAGRSQTMLLTAGEDRAGRVRLSIVPAPADIVALAPAPGNALDPVSDLMSTLAAGFLGRLATERIEAAVRSEAHQSELDQRLLPGIPSDIQFLYLGLLGIGALGWPVALRWWRRWRPRRLLRRTSTS